MSTSTTQPLIKTPKQDSQMSNPKTSTTMKDKTLTGLGNLIKLLPTGTVFIYQFLNPVLTNNGKCNTTHMYLSGVLFALCSFSCCFASFTDSYTDSDGETHYGIVTKNGLWPYTGKNEEVDFSKYNLRVGDFVHALMALAVFMVLSLLNTNTVECFYPSFESTEEMLLMVLPPVLGAMAGTVFVVFPNTRHGIGYPTTSTSASTS